MTLAGRVVVLEPLTLDHVGELVAAASEGRSSYAFTLVPDGPAAMTEYVRNACSRADQVPFAVRRLVDGRVVGCSRFLDCQVVEWPPPWPPGSRGGAQGTPTVTEIGSTWYAASVQRTAVNTETKLLMLTHAFEAWRVARVTLKTDARNERSRAAIERLGAVSEGVRRRHSPALDGGLRDTAYYSILSEEWPTVKERLTGRLF